MLRSACETALGPLETDPILQPRVVEFDRADDVRGLTRDARQLIRQLQNCRPSPGDAAVASSPWRKASWAALQSEAKPAWNVVSISSVATVAIFSWAMAPPLLRWESGPP